MSDSSDVVIFQADVGDKVVAQMVLPSAQVATLVPTRSDHEVADDIKRRLREALVPVLALMDEARAAGFIPHFSVGTNQLGRSAVTDVKLVREY